LAREHTRGTAKNAYATHTMVKPFSMLARIWGPEDPAWRIAALKSSTAFPYHIRSTINAVIPIRKPNRPSHATARLSIGLSSLALSFSPNFARKETKVNKMTKIVENTREMAMNTGVDAVGALSNFGALAGKTERS